jgi:hypothetical protein
LSLVTALLNSSWELTVGLASKGKRTAPTAVTAMATRCKLLPITLLTFSRVLFWPFAEVLALFVNFLFGNVGERLKVLSDPNDP